MGVDAHSTCCYLLAAAEHRDADTWAIHLMYACDQVLALAGPCLATRVELFDFVTAELVAREHFDTKRRRPVCVALRNQRDDLLAFAGVLDSKLEAIAKTHVLPMAVVRQACVLQRKP